MHFNLAWAITRAQADTSTELKKLTLKEFWEVRSDFQHTTSVTIEVPHTAIKDQCVLSDC